MRVCYFGHYFSDYQHNLAFQSALRQSGHEVVVVHSRKSRLIPRWVDLVRQARQVTFDVIFVGWPGHTDVPVAWFIGRMRRLPVVFDAFVSLYEGYVEDRALFEPKSLRARLLRRADEISCALADVVILDTNAHIDLFRDELGAERTRFERVFVGTADHHLEADEGLRLEHGTRVGLYASYLPLQGVDVVLSAADLLSESRPDIGFALVGHGFEASGLEARIDAMSIEYHGGMPYERLIEFMRGLDICLGVFGVTPKTARVIPNKVFDAMALGKAIVTADTKASRELLQSEVNAILVPTGQPDALAAAITRLADDPQLRSSLGRSARATFERSASVGATAGRLDAILVDVSGRVRGRRGNRR